jgi:outer membrane protein assembly factor BamB
MFLLLGIGGSAPGLWTFKVGTSVRTTVAVDGVSAFVGAPDGVVYSLNATSGAVNWRYDTRATSVGSPALDGLLDGFCYVTSYGAEGASGKLHSFHSNTGALRWQAEVRGWRARTPTVYGSNVYLASFDRDKHFGHVESFDAASGQVAWRRKLFTGGGISAVFVNREAVVQTMEGVVALGTFATYNSPGGHTIWQLERGLTVPPGSHDGHPLGRVVYDFSSRTYLVAAPDSKLVAFTPPATGSHRRRRVSTKASLKWEADLDSPALAAPLVSGDGRTVYAASVGTMTCNTRQCESLAAFDTANGAAKWRFALAGGFTSSPVLSSDRSTLYVGARDFCPSQTSTGACSVPAHAVKGGDAGVIALSATTGAVQWRFRTPASVLSSPRITAAGAVLVGCDDGVVYAVSECVTAPPGTFACTPEDCGAGQTGALVPRVVFASAQASPCDPCAPGTSKNVAGNDSCTPCPTTDAAGNTTFLMSGAGAAECTVCGAGVTFNGSALPCAPCQAGRFKAAAGNAPCVACLAGTTSAGGAGASSCIACLDAQWCLGDGKCVYERNGPGCTECAPGFAFFQGDCERCPAQAWSTLLPLFVLLTLASYVLRKLKLATDAAARKAMRDAMPEGARKKLDKAKAKAKKAEALAAGSYAMMKQVASLFTILTFVQMSDTLVKMDFGWPIDVRWFSDIIGKLAAFDLTGASAPECMVTMVAADRWIISLMVPIFPLLVLGLMILFLRILALPCGGVALFLRCKCKFSCRWWYETMLKKSGAMSSAALGFFLVTFLALGNAAASPFDCSGEDGKTYMRDAPDTQCKLGTTEGASGTFLAGDLVVPYRYRVAIASAALGCCAATIGIIAAILRCGRSKLFSNKLFMATYGSLYLRYNRRFYYWEVVILTRKLALVLITRVLSTSQGGQIACCFVVFGASLALQLWCTPFLSDGLDELERDVLVACVAIVLLGTAAYAGLPPAAITVLYFGILALAGLRIVRSLCKVWFEKEPSHSDAAPPSAKMKKTTTKGAPPATTLIGGKPMARNRTVV